jgi:large subunit ribosomal protein L4
MPQRRKKLTVSKKARPVRKKVKERLKKTVKLKKETNASARKPVDGGKKPTHEGVLPVRDFTGKSVDKMSLDPLFHEGKVNQDVIYQVVLMYQAGQREGTAATKDRGHVSGGGKKPWKQKGTGRARHASIRSPLWKGGGVTFGPMGRDYSYSVPAQLRRRAVAEGMKDKVLNGKLFMINRLEIEKPKTKIVAGILQAFKLEKPLVLVDKKDDNLLLASRNIRGVSLKTAEEVNVLDVVSHRECLMTQSAYTGLLKRLKS